MNGNLVLFLLAGALVACGHGAASAQNGSGTGTGGGGGSDGSGGAGGGSTAGHTTPDPQFLPTATGACPDFTSGKNTFSPAGIPARDVLLWLGAAGAQPGPLVFFWHGAGGDPSEAPAALGTKAMSGIQAAGGIVAAPYHDPTSTTLPWFLSLGGAQDDDLKVADEILACAIARKSVDLRRIHSVGFSAGAMNTEQFMARRSGWLASEVVYSGAQIGMPPVQDDTNKYPGMLFFGGPSDVVIISFATETQNYHDWMTMNGHFSFMCNHNMGHTVPSSGVNSAYQFLQDHPFGVSPEPYAKALPAGFPSYCSLQ
jgi:predicted esterase